MPRCACGCGRPTTGGPYVHGHNLVHRDHWTKLDSKKEVLHGVLLKRRAYVYRLLEEGRFVKDFDETYFRLFNRIRECDDRAELEVLVDTGDWWRAVDVAIPALKLGWEHDPGHRIWLGSAPKLRDQQLEQVGWKIVHLKWLPDREAILEHLAERVATISALDETSFSG